MSRLAERIGYRTDWSVAATLNIVQISDDNSGRIPNPLRLTVPEEFRGSIDAHVGIRTRGIPPREECVQQFFQVHPSFLPRGINKHE